MRAFLAECRRRRVFRLAATYVVTVWVVLQAAELAFESWAVPLTALQYFWIGALLGFPIALFFGWRFDVVDGRIVRTPAAEGETELALERSDYVILSVFVIAAVAIVFEIWSGIARIQMPESKQDWPVVVDPASIAVMPFSDMSDSQDQEYFAHGIAEELLDRLAKVKGFQVTGRTSSFAMREQRHDLAAVRQTLGVATILDGSVRKSGKQLRITARLVNTADGFHLWSESYDRELENVFSIQDEIARSVVSAITSTLLESDKTLALGSQAVTDTTAYDLYLQGRHQVYKRAMGSERQARSLFQQASQIDPDFAAAYAGIAMALVLGYGAEQIATRVENAVDRALALDNGNSEALTALGLLRQMQGRRAESQDALQQAIASNANNAQAHTWLGRLFADVDDARYLKHVRDGYRIDPLDATTLWHLSKAAARSGFYSEALTAARDRHAVEPGSAFGYVLAGDVHHFRGHVGNALKSYYHAFLLEPDAMAFALTQRSMIVLQERELAWAWVEEAKHTGSPLAEPVLTFLDGRREEANRLYARRGGIDNKWMGIWLVWFGGDLEGARAAFERHFEVSGQSATQVDPEDWVWYTEYALALQRTGEVSRANELIAQLRTLIDRQLAAGVKWTPRTQLKLRVTSSALHAMSGDTQQALAELQQAYEQEGGLWCWWCMRHWPHWEKLHGDPVFEGLLDRQQEAFATQRQCLASNNMLLTPEQVLKLENISFDPFEDGSSSC